MKRRAGLILSLIHIFLGAVAGIFAVLIDLRLPQVLEGMVSSMAGVATPMALLTLGAFFDFQSLSLIHICLF